MELTRQLRHKTDMLRLIRHLTSMHADKLRSINNTQITVFQQQVITYKNIYIILLLPLTLLTKTCSILWMH